MGWGSKDVYYDASEFGLEKVLEINEKDLAYEFDMFVVWKKDDVYYWASDSGCSCPSPFENYTSVEMLEHGPKERARDAAIEYVRELEKRARTYAYSGGADMTVDEVRRALA